MTAPRPVEPRPAATVVLVRPGPAGLEVLLTHRPSTMAFAAGVHVFPGGRVDAGDAAFGHDPAAVAAIREAFEEVGVWLGDAPPGTDLPAARARLLAGNASFAELVAELGLRPDVSRLVRWSRWVTPPTMARRFDTRFFVAAMPDGVEATLTGDEVAGHGWHTPRAALDGMAAGTIEMWLPTSCTLQQLEPASSFADIAALDSDAPSGGAVELEIIDDDVTRLTMPDGGGMAGQPIHAYLVGRREVVLVDPGDPTPTGTERALEVVARRGGRIAAVALTHVDPDHGAGAESLAERLSIPMFASPVRAADVPHVTSPLADGEIVGAGDVRMRVVATPGPAADHVAFVVGAGALVISGDLDGVRGARSLLRPPDQAAWSASVDRLRAAAPAARWLGGHPPPPGDAA